MKKKKIFYIDLAILAVTAVIFAITMSFTLQIDLALSFCHYEDADDNIVSAGNAEGSASETLEVHFVDVGQGDCCIIEFPDGKTAIIDGGENDKTHVTQIETFIKNNLPEDFKYFDYCILTHPDSDHCGSLDDILNEFPARVCYRPNVKAVGTKTNRYDDPCTSLTSDAREKDTAVYARAIKAMYTPTSSHDFTPTVFVTDPTDDTQTISGGTTGNEYSLSFYTPLSTKYTGSGDWNNYSPVMTLDYEGFSFVMSGDAEGKNLTEFVNKVTYAAGDGVTDKYDRFTDDYCASVIKAGHHGSTNATTTEFLDAVTSPDKVKSTFSVISCGAGNSYNHPHEAALDRIKAEGITQEHILRTDEVGDISFSVKTDENGIYNLYYGNTVTPQKEQKEKIVYKRIADGKIKLSWAWIAWVIYGIVAVVVLIHMLIIAVKKRGSDSSKKPSNK